MDDIKVVLTGDLPHMLSLVKDMEWSEDRISAQQRIGFNINIVNPLGQRLLSGMGKAKVIDIMAPVQKIIHSVDDMQGVEGVVFRLASGQRVKKKGSWYLALHHTKDSINTPRRLYEAVLEEATDDMRSLFHDDPLAIKLITEMEEFVEVRFNHLVDTVERFYERNKELERKDYAILGQEELTRMQFGLAMNKYTGKTFSYKDVMKKAWKSFGLKDEKVEAE